MKDKVSSQVAPVRSRRLLEQSTDRVHKVDERIMIGRQVSTMSDDAPNPAVAQSSNLSSQGGAGATRKAPVNFVLAIVGDARALVEAYPHGTSEMALQASRRSAAFPPRTAPPEELKAHSHEPDCNSRPRGFEIKSPKTPNGVVKNDFLLRVPTVWQQLRWSRQDNPQCITEDTPPFIVSTPPRFAQNPRNSNDGTLLHYPGQSGFDGPSQLKIFLDSKGGAPPRTERPAGDTSGSSLRVCSAVGSRFDYSQLSGGAGSLGCTSVVGVSEVGDLRGEHYRMI
jgi:hypothetical protein